MTIQHVALQETPVTDLDGIGQEQFNLGLPTSTGLVVHDPLRPDREVPTPIDMVMRLTRSQREDRVKRLLDLAWMRVDEAVSRYGNGKNITHTAALFSGGNDSATVASIFRPILTTIIHANTGTGIEATREHVRAVAAAWGLRLVEEVPDEGEGYRDLVLNTIRSKRTGDIVWKGGFPGPASHGLMQQRLKERLTDKARHTLGIANSQTKRGLWIAGRRRAESEKRATIPHYDSDGSVIWVSPIAVWHKADLRTYRLMHDVPLNPVAEKLGMSGECGCLANAKAGEPERWREAYPDDPFLSTVIPDLEEALKDREDIPPHRRKWGWGGQFDDRVEMKALDEQTGEPGRLCGKACGHDPLLDLMDPLFPLEESA